MQRKRRPGGKERKTRQGAKKRLARHFVVEHVAAPEIERNRHLVAGTSLRSGSDGSCFGATRGSSVFDGVGARRPVAWERKRKVVPVI